VGSSNTPFNPTLVQFKPVWCANGNNVAIGFQSYLSPIQTSRHQRLSTPIVCFQSYLSPIQTERPGSCRGRARPFQSYLSPIQTKIEAGLPIGFSVFQSYLSPIQTEFAKALIETKVTSFNPTLVQFKLQQAQVEYTIDRSFQSYLSPIQTAICMVGNWTASHFQSYLSPIQTRRDTRRDPGSRGLSILP